MFDIVQCLSRVQRLGIVAEFSWVPTYVGLKGNEFADRMAKRSLNMRHIIDIPFGKGEGKA